MICDDDARLRRVGYFGIWALVGAVLFRVPCPLGAVLLLTGTLTIANRFV